MKLPDLKQAGSSDKLANLLLDTKKPPETRAKMLIDLFVANKTNPKALQGVAAAMFQKMAEAGPVGEVMRLKEHYEQALAELENGPARPATFIGEAEGEMPGPKPRAHVVTPEGHGRFPFLYEKVKLPDLKPGSTLYLDAKGAVVLGHSNALPAVGQEATFLRRLPETGEVEVSVHEERVVLHASQLVLDAVEEGTLSRGDRVLVCPRREFAFRVIPGESDRRHRFVDDSKIPDVVASRDIGRPHWSLGYLIKRTRILMFRPDLLERYDLRPRCAMLMVGPPGTGKTLTIRAFLREFHNMVAERTGRTDLGSRIIRMKASELLSEWFGMAEKLMEEFFDNIQSIGSEEIETADGERVRVPVVIIFEEAEGLSRRRGDYDGAIYDRVMGTLLQRLDDVTEDLARLPLIFISSSNRPDVMDAAMWRRLGGMIARFKRLDREGVAAVLAKKIKPHYPFASANGHAGPQPALSHNGEPEALRAMLIDQVVSHLYSPNGSDRGQVEITLRDGKKLVKYRRDFVTPAIIEQSVANAVDRLAFTAEQRGEEVVGLTAAAVIESLDQQLDSLADNLTVHNLADYVDVPDHARVADIRRVPSANGRLASLVAPNNE